MGVICKSETPENNRLDSITALFMGVICKSETPAGKHKVLFRKLFTDVIYKSVTPMGRRGLLVFFKKEDGRERKIAKKIK